MNEVNQELVTMLLVYEKQSHNVEEQPLEQFSQFSIVSEKILDFKNNF